MMKITSIYFCFFILAAVIVEIFAIRVTIPCWEQCKTCRVNGNIVYGGGHEELGPNTYGYCEHYCFKGFCGSGPEYSEDGIDCHNCKYAPNPEEYKELYHKCQKSNLISTAYRSLERAWEDCATRKSCEGVIDPYCDGKSFYSCELSEQGSSSTHDGCLYRKPGSF